MSYLIFNSDFLTALRIIHMINNIHFVVLLTLLLYRGKVTRYLLYQHLSVVSRT